MALISDNNAPLICQEDSSIEGCESPPIREFMCILPIRTGINLFSYSLCACIAHLVHVMFTLELYRIEFSFFPVMTLHWDIICISMSLSMHSLDNYGLATRIRVFDLEKLATFMCICPYLHSISVGTALTQGT